MSTISTYLAIAALGAVALTPVAHASEPPKALQLSAEGHVCIAPEELAMVPLQLIFGGGAKGTLAHRMVQEAIKQVLKQIKGTDNLEEKTRLAQVLVTLSKVEQDLVASRAENKQGHDITHGKLDEVIKQLQELNAKQTQPKPPEAKPTPRMPRKHVAPSKVPKVAPQSPAPHEDILREFSGS